MFVTLDTLKKSCVALIKISRLGSDELCIIPSEKKEKEIENNEILSRAL